MATTAIAGYAIGRDLVGAAAFLYAVSVGWYGGVLSGSARFLDLGLGRALLSLLSKILENYQSYQAGWRYRPLTSSLFKQGQLKISCSSQRQLYQRIL